MSGARFTIVGAGGLGGPIALALAAARPARLTIIDDDAVELSNLQRQVQFGTADLGARKAATLAAALIARGLPAAVVRAIDARFTAKSAAALLADDDDGGASAAHVIIDGSDNFATKFAVADAAIAAGAAHVIAGVSRYGGQIYVGGPGAACYRCLFEAAPDDDTGSCADAGVLGAVVGAIGGLAALAALALADGDRRATGSVTVLDDLRGAAAPRTVRFAPRPGCPACATAPVRLSDSAPLVARRENRP